MSTWTAAWKVTKLISDLEESEMEWVPPTPSVDIWW